VHTQGGEKQKKKRDNATRGKEKEGGENQGLQKGGHVTGKPEKEVPLEGSRPAVGPQQN